jgi:transcription initiation factor TFIID subunit TAF12
MTKQEQQQQEQQQQEQQPVEQQQQQQRQLRPAQSRARAPVSMGGADVVATLASSEGITPSSITSALIVWSPRAAAAEGSDGVAALSGSSSSGSGLSAQPSVCLWRST